MQLIFLGINLINYIIFALAVTRDLEVRMFFFWMIAFLSFLLYFQKIRFENFSLQKILIFSLLLRLPLLLMIPNLSDDFFRFVWDGHLILQKENPFAVLPAEHSHALAKTGYWFSEIYQGQIAHFPDGMNSKNYYSVYPPFAQFFFALASFIAGENLLVNLIVLRVFFIGFDLGLIVLMAKIADKKHCNRIFLYALNPLVIVELIGNLHFEGLALFFIFLAIFLLKKQRVFLAAVSYALAILTKLIPFFLFGIFYFLFQRKKLLIFYTIVVFTILVFFFPFVLGVNLWQTFGSSLQLYFSSFEFNASIYYIFRAVGFFFKGYNVIATWGMIYPIIFCFGMLTILWAYRHKTDYESVFSSAVLILFLYYALASVVHPWYVIYLLAFSVFTSFSFPLVWSGLIFLSYWAYRDIGIVKENLWLVSLEYTIVFLFFLGDIRRYFLRNA